MVSELTAGLPSALLDHRPDVRVGVEVAVGRSIADVVCLAALEPVQRQPRAPLSITESVILSTLRIHGATRIDLLEKRCGVEHGALRSGTLRRLLEWGLVAAERGGRVSDPTNWTAPFELLAIEAKLTRWRDALRQASSYLSFADRSFVALPAPLAGTAVDARAAFACAGIGLLLVESANVTVAWPAPSAALRHDWRREFVISRLLE